MKKVFTIVVSCLCVIGMAVVAVWYAVDNQLIEFDNVYTSISAEPVTSADEQEATSETSAERKNVDINGNDLGYPLISAWLMEGAEVYLQYYPLEDNLESHYGDLYIKLNSIEITKKRGDFDACDDWEEAQDSQGNLNDEYSYVVFNVTVKNLSEKAYTTYVNHYMPVSLGGLCELRSYNSGKVVKTLQEEKSYFEVEYEPNVEYNYNLVTILEDEEINEAGNELYLYVEDSCNPWKSEFPIIGKKVNG